METWESPPRSAAVSLVYPQGVGALAHHPSVRRPTLSWASCSWLQCSLPSLLSQKTNILSLLQAFLPSVRLPAAPASGVSLRSCLINHLFSFLGFCFCFPFFFLNCKYFSLPSHPKSQGGFLWPCFSESLFLVPFYCSPS